MINSPRTAMDWMEGYLSSGVIPRFLRALGRGDEASLVLTPNNHIPGAALNEITPDGGTSFMRLLKPPRHDGDHFYLSEMDASSETLAKQTFSPFEVGKPWFSTQTRIPGPRPLGPADATLAPVELKAIELPPSQQGYKGGVRLAALSVMTEGGAHTTISDTVEFSHANGVSLEWTLPSEISEGGWGFGLWLSEEVPVGQTPDPSTIRFQRKVKHGIKRITLTGPYRYDSKKPSTKNDTEIGRATRPTVEMRRGAGDLQPMALSVFIVEVTSRGDSLASHDVSRRSGGAQNRAFWVRPAKPSPDATGYKVYCRLETGGPTYRLVMRKRVYRDRPFPIREAVPIYGYIDTGDGSVGTEESLSEDTSGETSRGSAPRIPPGINHVLIPEEPASEDSSGIEPLSGEIEPPRGVGSGRPPAGRYGMTYAPVENGQEQRHAPARRVAITTTQVIRAMSPPRVNRLANAEARERDSVGSPIGWFYELTGGVQANEPGKVGVRTSAPQGGAQAATTTPRVTSESLSPNPERVETIRGVLEVSGRTSGSGLAVLVEKNDTGVETRTTLKTLSQNGRSEYRRTISAAGGLAPPPGMQNPDGSPVAHAYLREDTIEFFLRYATSGDGRNLTVRGYDHAVHPFAGAPRKFSFPADNEAEMADPNPLPEEPYPSGSVVCITTPKATPQDTPPELPIDTLTLEDSQDATTKGFQKLVSSTASTGAELSTIAALKPSLVEESLYGLRAYNFSTGSRANAYYAKTYTDAQVGGGSLAAHLLQRYPTLPSRSGTALNTLAILTAGGAYLGFVRVYNGGSLRLYSRDRYGKERYVQIGYVNTSDLLDVEIVASGGGTKAGAVTLLLGKNGETRRVLGTITNVDFTGVQPRRIAFGGILETSPTSTWEVYSDSLYTTKTGDVLERAQATPPGELPAEPDRPVGADGQYREYDEAENQVGQFYAHVVEGDEDLGFVLDDFVVKPEVPQTFAAYFRTEDVLGVAEGPALTLYNANGEAYEASFDEVPSSSGSSGSIHGEGITGTNPWGEAVLFYTPPAGFFRARVVMRESTPGLYLYQDPLHAEGTLATQAERDAKRNEGRATEGEFSAIIPARPEANPEGVLDVYYGYEWLGCNLGAQVPEGTSVEALYRSTPLPTPIFTGEPFSDPALVKPGRFAEVSGTLLGDGILTPEIAPNSLHASFAPYLGADRLSALTEDDGTPIHGGCVVDGLEDAFTRPDYATDPVGGHANPRPLTDNIQRLGPFKAYLFTERGARWLEEQGARGVLSLEAPGFGGGDPSSSGSSGGRLFRIKLFGLPDVVEMPHSSVYRDGVRYAWGVADIPGAEVIESGMLA